MLLVLLLFYYFCNWFWFVFIATINVVVIALINVAVVVVVVSGVVVLNVTTNRKRYILLNSILWSSFFPETRFTKLTFQLVAVVFGAVFYISYF